MALFIGVHDVGEAMPEEKMVSSWEAYKAACDKRGSKAIRAHQNAEMGRAYCLTDADSAEDVQAAHDEAQVPVNEIVPVKIVE